MAQRSRSRSSQQLGAHGFGDSVLRRVIVALVAVKLIGICLLLDPMASESFAVPKAAWSRALEWLIVAAIVGAFLRFGPSIAPRTRLHRLVIAYAVVTVAASVVAANPYLAVFGTQNRHLGLTYVLDMVVLYLAIAIAVRRRGDWAVIGGALLMSTVLTVGYEIVQLAHRDPITWFDDFTGRQGSTFGNAGIFGEYVLTITGASLGIGALAKGWSRVAGLGVGLLGLAGVGMAAARSSLVGLAAAVVVIVLLRSTTKGASLRGAVAVGIAALALVLTAVVVASPLGIRVLFEPRGANFADRIAVYRVMVDAIAARPILGWGPDNVAVAWVAHRSVESVDVLGELITDNAHSWPLQAAVTTGLVGLAVLLTLLAKAAAALRQGRQREPIVAGALLVGGAAYLASALTTVGSPATGWIPWLLIGGAAALDGRVAPASVVGRWPTPGPWRLAVTGIVLIALIGVGAWRSIEVVSADRAARLARLVAAQGVATLAVSQGQIAVGEDPDRSESWESLGEAYYAARRYRDAGDAFAEAARRSPYLAVLWQNLAKSRAEQASFADLSSGGFAAALGAAATAVRTDPNIPGPHATFAETAARAGQPLLAVKDIVVPLRLAPSSLAFELIASDIMSTVHRSGNAGDGPSAKALLETEALTHDGPVLRVVLAHLCVDLRDFDCARKNASRAVELQPGKASALEILRVVGNPVQ